MRIRVNGTIFFMLMLTMSLVPSKIFCQTVVKYNLLESTSSEFSLLKKNATPAETKNHYFEKYVYVDGILDSILLYNPKGQLYDYSYQSAIIVYKYSGNQLKFMKLFNKNRQRVEDSYLGLWSTEYFYDQKGRIVKEINRNKNNTPVKYMHGFDMITPYSKFLYLNDGRCVEKDFDNDEQLIYEDTCACPHMETKLSEYDSVNH
jgi:hypothetical protein